MSQAATRTASDHNLAINAPANIAADVAEQSYSDLTRDWDAINMHDALPEHVQALVMKHYRAYAIKTQLELDALELAQ